MSEVLLKAGRGLPGQLVSYKTNTEASTSETINSANTDLENKLKNKESENINSGTSKESKKKDRKSETLNAVLLELHALREEVSQQSSSITSLKELVTTLTGEVVASRNEVRELKKLNIPVDQGLISKKLPFTSLDEFRSLDMELTENSDRVEEFKRIIRRVGGADAPTFVRAAIKRVITDDLAVRFSWKGTKTKHSIENRYFISLLREVWQQKFDGADDSILNHVLQQHFEHAKDRLAKGKDRPNSNQK